MPQFSSQDIASVAALIAGFAGMLTGCYSGASDDDETVLVIGDAADTGTTAPDTRFTPPPDGSGPETSGPMDTGPTGNGDGLTISPARITAGQTAQFRLPAEPPLNPADVVGVRLNILDGPTVLDEMSLKGGAFVGDVSWSQLNQLTPITFQNDATRFFEAVVIFKQGANQSFKAKLKLHCDGKPACNGACNALECEGHCRPWRTFASDPDHCGGCNQSCGDGNTCRNYQCVCKDGQTPCNGICVDRQSNPYHCGKCGRTCPSSQACDQGTCTTPQTGGICRDDSDCVGAECVSGLSEGREGVCLAECSQNGTRTCPAGSICLAKHSSTAPLPYCLRTCQNRSDCRTGEVCISDDRLGIGSQKICAPESLAP